ncbi:MAG: PilZ domain-containing protein [Candidatus Scalindua sp.]|nr:PilZ domain-containing protein [Candidatus Scalindua sp.]
MYANKIGLLDYSNKRKVHKVGRPLIGGIAIAISLSVSCFLYIETKQIFSFYVGMFIVLLTGFCDDYKKLTPKWKLLAQIITAIIVIHSGKIVLLSFGNILSFGPVNLGIFAVPVTILYIVGVINATNMIDGVDGLVGTVSTIAFISFGILAYINNQPLYLLLSIALSGCVIAFLRYNWNPSILFLGDAGSFLLGFSMAFLSIAISQKQNSVVPPFVPLLILAFPIADLTSVSLRRIINGKNPFSADKSHIHHILLRLGFKKKYVVLIIALTTTIFSALGIAGTIYRIPEYYLFSIFLAFFIVHFTFSLCIKKLLRFKVRGKKGWHHVQTETAPMEPMHKMVKISNKRIYLRNTRCSKILCMIETDKRELFNTSELMNISFNGFAAKTDEYLTNCEHKINLVLPENNNVKGLSTIAEVVWMHRDNGSYIYGFKFREMGKEQRDILKCYL